MCCAAVKMEVNNMHYCHILLRYLKKGKRAAEAHRKICRVYRNNALSEGIYQKWFAKFRSGDFDVNNVLRSGCPTEIGSSDFKVIIDKNPS